VADVDGFGVVVDVLRGKSHAQAGPLFGEDDAVLGIAGLVARGAGKTGANLGDFDDIEEGRDVLSALIVDAAEVIVVYEQNESVRSGVGIGFGWAWDRDFDFADVKQHAVDEASGMREEKAAGALQFFRCGALAEGEPDGDRARSENEGQPGGNFPIAYGEEGHWWEDSELDAVCVRGVPLIEYRR
jgi:hypothetical protein